MGLRRTADYREVRVHIISVERLQNTADGNPRYRLESTGGTWETKPDGTFAARLDASDLAGWDAEVGITRDSRGVWHWMGVRRIAKRPPELQY